MIRHTRAGAEIARQGLFLPIREYARRLRRRARMSVLSKKLAWMPILAFVMSTGAAHASGFLIAGRDTEDFARQGTDQLAKTPTTGTTAGATALINTSYQVN